MSIHECPDCGQAMIIKTISGRCYPCLKEYYRRLAAEWDRAHPNHVHKPRAAGSRR